MNLPRFATVAVASAAAVTLAAGPALAAVTFDPATGTGFVGKGDVQLAFGWKNAQLQTNAAAVTFAHETTDVYTVTCSWTTGEGTRGEKKHNVNRKSRVDVTSAILGDPRQVKGQNQFTGFNLNGFDGEPDVVGDVPVVGDACSREQSEQNQGALVSAVDEDPTQQPGAGQLLVIHNGITKTL